MMRSWIAVALLSLSWMLGLEYYGAPNGWFWALAVIAAAALLSELPGRRPSRTDAVLAAVLAAPVVWLAPWPYRLIPLALALGLCPFALGHAPRFVAALGWGAVRSSAILAAQAVALRGYSLMTARSHDLPWPGAEMVSLAARLAGVEASADGAIVAMFSASGPQRLAATWELVFDPVTLGLAVGGAVLVAIWAWEDHGSDAPAEAAPAGLAARLPWLPAACRKWLGSLARLVLVVLAWAPVRLVLLIGWFLHREMRAPADLKLTVMNQFLSPWVLAAASSGAVAGAWWFVGRRRGEAMGEEAGEEPRVWPRLVSVSVLVGITFAAFLLLRLEPVGAPRGGRIAFVERHSDWEPTDRPYDTESYGHDPSYSYTNIYRFCGQYFDVSRIGDEEKIDSARLAECDVLVIKNPTEAYAPEEILAVHRFVENGGGLLLIGEHTDIDRMSTHLNRITARFGFKFRPDILFSVEDPYVQYVAPRMLPHPAVRNVPPMMYAGSCSIDPGLSLGRVAVWNTGLWSLGANYNASNFFPEAQYWPEMRYGAFIQLWETRYGRGRVLAFTDSTIFSNFSTFEPGKAELMLDMLSWLNSRGMFDSAAVRVLVRLAGLALLGAAVWLAVTRYQPAGARWLVWFGCGLLGFSAAAAVLAASTRGGLPERKRPLVRVVLDRTVSRVPLSAGGFTRDPFGYGLVEQWITRLGHHTVRAEGSEAFSGDVLLVLSPTGSVSETYRRQLVQYVSEGGKLIVFDSPDVVGTTANSLLWPFGLASYHATAAEGRVLLDHQWPGLVVQATCEIAGGEPLMRVGKTPVAARAAFGKGSVTAIGFGSLMNNQNMGGHWMAEPGPYQRAVFNVLYEVLDSVVEGRPMRPRGPAWQGGESVRSSPSE